MKPVIVTYAHFGSLTLLFKAILQELELPDERIIEPTPPSKLTIEIGRSKKFIFFYNFTTSYNISYVNHM